MKKALGLYLSIWAVFALTSVSHAQQREKASYRLTFFLTGAAGPVILALEKDLFEEQGIALEVLEGRGTGTNLKLVAAGQETFAEAECGELAKAISEGMPLKVIFGRLQVSPMAVISLEESGIRSPKDLLGKTIGAFAGSANSMLFPALMKANRLDTSQVKMAYMEQRALIPTLLQKRLDAILLHYITNVPLLEERGAKVSYFLYRDYGVNMLANSTIVNRKLIAESPGLIRRFLVGVTKGFELAMKEPEAAADALLKKGAREKKELLVRGLKEALELLYTPASRGKPIGWMAKKDWEDTQELMLQFGGMKKRLPVEELYTNEFIP